ncbi:dTDP-D-glucose 4,6-dehydratase, partial [Orchesella cincta]
ASLPNLTHMMASTPENGHSTTFPKFLILGGCGFIGRHLVSYLLDKSSVIFIIDKTSPQVAWLNPQQADVFKDPKVKFTSANLITLQGCERAFDTVDDDIDYVINLAAETRKGQTEPVYRDGILQLCKNVCQFVDKKFGSRLQCYVELSSGFLYTSEKTPHKESDKADLWNHETRYKYEA